MAVLLGIKSLLGHRHDIHVRCQIDNTTAVAYVDHIGGVKSKHCNEVAIDLWNWCFERNIWLSAEHFPGPHNIVADRESRNFNDSTEWTLDSTVFEKLCSINLYAPEIDLFASSLNFQTPCSS